MRRSIKLSFAALIPFALIGILFGILYNALFYPHTLVEYVEASMIGLLLGLIAGFAEQIFLQRWFDRRSFLHALILRTGLYAFFVAMILCFVLAIEPAILGNCSYPQCVINHLKDPLFLRDLVFSTMFVFFTAFTAQVVMLIGASNFLGLLLGKYRQPHEVYAIFMFADLRSSTTIAEQLGHEQFSAFLRDFFNDVSAAIYAAKGEIYQYVGDEVVVVWRGDQSKDQTYWLDCYEDMQADLKRRASTYRDKYGVVPTFKAGIHGGLVVVTEVGTLQKAHVYHGDVLNTAARIQSKCNEIGFDLLVSESLISSKSTDRIKEFTKVGALTLRGKSEEVIIYGFDKSTELVEV